MPSIDSIEGFFCKQPKGKDVDVAEVKKTMKGPSYLKAVEHYVFQKKEGLNEAIYDSNS
ncbi:hypothetical protein KD909_03780 [Exiguobacterium sp. PFWT01]|uniref:hypothetical protein n=1 Tax=Exiguobacterium sp. PFWT01 TaxID=2829816 RepID=UPI001BA46458|nr:hypothetical protein [Exiguobacterium sp. PFWT01]QUP87867.1 hypothetical protein KD909_03780 [Exiguobacterium sp. PFWT01]